jgi:hypothetical protein
MRRWSHPPPESLNDRELYQGFLSARLAASAFGHREHLRAAFLFLRRYPDFAVAASRFRRTLSKFADRHGVSHRYHETLTWAYLALTHERMKRSRARTSLGFLRNHPELVDHRHGALSEYYDVAAVTRSRAARKMFLLPKARRRRTKP